MSSVARAGSLLAALGLLSGSLLSFPAADAATTPQCYAGVIGVLPSGRLVQRELLNARILGEQKSAPLPIAVDALYSSGVESTSTGSVEHLVEHRAGRPARDLDVILTKGSSVLGVRLGARYRPSITARLEAGSGRFYTYGVASNGALTRWTRFIDNAGHVWFGNAKVVAPNMGSLKTLSYDATADKNGIRDVLYGTTNGGALKQIQIPWSTPGKPRITTLARTGFASYTGLSLSYCNGTAGTTASIIAIDRTHNRARWYTFSAQFSPKPANLVRRQLVGVGAQWRLHATD